MKEGAEKVEYEHFRKWGGVSYPFRYFRNMIYFGQILRKIIQTRGGGRNFTFIVTALKKEERQ